MRRVTSYHITEEFYFSFCPFFATSLPILGVSLSSFYKRASSSEEPGHTVGTLQISSPFIASKL